MQCLRVCEQTFEELVNICQALGISFKGIFNSRVCDSHAVPESTVVRSIKNFWSIKVFKIFSILFFFSQPTRCTLHMFKCEHSSVNLK